MVTKCLAEGKIFRCSVNLEKGSLVIKRLDEDRPLEIKLPFTNVKDVLLVGDRVRLISSDGFVTEVFVNEIVRKELSFTVLIVKYLKEGATLRERLETLIERYVFLNGLALKLITSLAKSAMPDWAKVRELSLRINDVVSGFQDLDVEYLKLTSSKLLRDVEIRDVTQISMDVKNLVRYAVSTFKEAIKKMDLGVDATPLIDLTLLTFVYRYSKDLGLVIQAEKTFNMFIRSVEEFAEGLIGFNESLKSGFINGFLDKFKADEDILQTSKAYLNLIESTVREFL